MMLWYRSQNWMLGVPALGMAAERALFQMGSIPIRNPNLESDSNQPGFSATGKYLQVFSLHRRGAGGVFCEAPVETKQFLLIK